MASIMEMLFGGQMPNQTPADYDQAQGILASNMGPPRSAMMPPQASQGSGALNAAPSPGILDSLGIKTDNFTGRLGNALIAAGSRDPGNTLLNLQKADSDAAAASRPKVTPLADGAFSLISFPDGSTKIVKNEDVAQYVTDQNQAKFLQGLIKTQVTADANANAGNNKVAFKADLEQAGGPGASTTYRESVTTQLGKIDSLITGIPEIDKIKTQFGNIDSPAIANFIDQTVGRVAGSDAYSLRRDFDSLIGEDVLKLAERMKGALSDKDVMFLKSIQPKPDDPTDRKVTYLKELKKRLDDGEKRRVEAAVRVSGQGGGNALSASAPKTSGGVVQVTSEEQWKQLPPDTIYRDPTGVVRIKK